MFLRHVMGIVVGGATGGITGALVGAVGYAIAEAGFGRGIGIAGPSPLMGAVAGILMVGLAGCAAGTISGGIGGARKWSGVAGAGVGLLAAIYVYSVNATHFAAFGAIASISALLGSICAGLVAGGLSRRWVYRNPEPQDTARAGGARTSGD
jgi:hypothetical protein